MNCAYHKDRESESICVACGKFICEGCMLEIEGKKYCKKCMAEHPVWDQQQVGGKNWMVTLLLAIFLGTWGIHRFYTGKIGTGLLMLFTLGGCGIWVLIDIISIAMGSYTDSTGQSLAKN